MTLSIDRTTTVAADEEPVVSFDRTLSKWLVHRAANAEVLLTSFHQRDEARFVIGAQLPRTHALYRPVMGGHDPMLFAEAIRQAGLAVSQLGFEVPQGHQAVMWSLSHELITGGLDLAGGPAQLTLETECDQLKWHGRKLAGFRMRATVYREGARVGNAEVNASFLSPAVYARLRANIDKHAFDSEQPPLPDPVPAELVGRDRPGDVVLAPTDRDDTWWLRTDRNHPILFEHPVDHVPGMALLEGMRQAVQLARPQETVRVANLVARFHRYVELDSSCFIRVSCDSTTAGVHIIAEQNGETAAEATFDALPTSESGKC